MKKRYVALPFLSALMLVVSPAHSQTITTHDHASVATEKSLDDISSELTESGIRELGDGVKIVGADFFTVLVEGEGPDVVLIPGLATPRAVWDKTREQLKARYKVHTIQTRGFGDAPPIETLEPKYERRLLDRYALHVADYIDDYVIRIEGGQNPAIIGHSMGGLTAMMVAKNMGHQVDRVMVVDSLPFIGLLGGPNATVAMVKPQAAAMRDMMLARENGEADERTLQTMSATEEGRAQVKAWSRTADAKTTAAYFYDIVTTDLRPDLPNISVPMTVLYPFDKSVMGEDAVNKLYGFAYKDAKSAKLIRVDDSRHFIMLDQPEQFAGAVDAFLADMPSE